jgi:hypothetical protein
MLPQLIIWAILMVGLFLLTRPLELRRWRRLRLLASAPLVLAAARLPLLVVGYGRVDSLAFGILGILSLALLALLWTDVLSHHSAVKISGFIFGDGCGGGGFHPDYKDARACIEGNDFQGAIKCVEAELMKRPNDFEGRLLLAALYKELKQPGRGLPHVEIILGHAELTEPQKAQALAAQAELQILQIKLDDERHRG